MIFFIFIGVILLIGIIISAREALYYEYDGGRNRGWSLGEFLVGLFWTAVVAAVATVFFVLIVGTSSTGYDKVRTELRALGNTSETSGGFFLGTGVVDEEQVFQYLEQAEDGGVTLHTIEAWRVVVYEDSAKAGYMIENRPYFDDPMVFPGRLPSRSDEYTTEFHVPEGSINNEYHISVTE